MSTRTVIGALSYIVVVGLALTVVLSGDAASQDITKLEKDGTITCTWIIAGRDSTTTVVVNPEGDFNVVLASAAPPEPDGGYHTDITVLDCESRKIKGQPVLLCVLRGRISKSMADPFDSYNVSTSTLSSMAGLPGTRINITVLGKRHKTFEFYGRTWTVGQDKDAPSYVVVTEKSIVGVNATQVRSRPRRSPPRTDPSCPPGSSAP
jgi:hypothetical protein